MERPSIDRVARCIGDPVIRLRFLKAAAPLTSWNEDGRRRSRWSALCHYLLLAVVPLTLIAAFLVVRAAARTAAPDAWKAPVAQPQAVRAPALPEVWMVEKSAGEEVFSNGLHIDTRFTVSTHPRGYLAFPKDRPLRANAVHHATPAGIVFHTTESLLIPFEAHQNGALKRIGESLLQYVARRQSYHYLIDRFGRVFRVVAEQDAADHAGYSVWADERWLYLNLNESFLGVSFEARTRTGESAGSLSPAQVRSAAMLTELLRGRYRIPASNCVTHMQVSVNPGNMLVGYHTDWVSGFPFEQLGLPDNYSLPLPSMATFGFVCDKAAREAAAPRLLEAIARTESGLEERAETAGLRLPAYRRMLQHGYRDLLASVKTEQHAGNDGDGSSGP